MSEWRVGRVSPANAPSVLRATPLEALQMGIALGLGLGLGPDLPIWDLPDSLSGTCLLAGSSHGVSMWGGLC